MTDRDVPADMYACDELDRKAKIQWLMSTERHVRISNPTKPGSSWTGTIIGMIDVPAMVIEMDNGNRWALPQCFAVEDLSTLPIADDDGNLDGP